MAYTLWTRFLRHAPTHPDWPNRDRFVLSAGHASMLLYSLLHLTGYDLHARAICSASASGARGRPGHPEYGLTAGVEATTGPLGQGFANAVGMAIAERRLAAEFNRPGHDDRRPLDVRDLLRRRPPGGDRVGGRLARRPPAAGQAGLPLRRQPHPARRADRDGLLRGRAWRGSTPTAGTPSGSRTATTSRRSRRPSGPPARTTGRASIAVRTHIGFGSPNKQDSPEGPRRAARRRRGPLHEGGLRLGPGPHLLRPRRRRGALPRAIPYGEQLSADWEERVRRATRPPSRPGRASCERRLGGRPARRLGRRASRRYAVGEDSPTRQVSQAAIQALAAALPGAVRRLGRPLRDRT